MSNKALTWAFGQPLAGNEKVVLLVIADSLNPETLRCFPSVGFIADRACISERTVTRVIQELEERSFIIREYRYTDSGRQTSCEFRLPIDVTVGVNLSPRARGEGDNLSGGEGDTVVRGEGDTRVTPEGDNAVTPYEPKEEPKEGTHKEGDLFEAAPATKPVKARKTRTTDEPIILKLAFVSYTQKKLDHIKATCPGIDIEAELHSLTAWMEDRGRAGVKFADPYGFVLGCLRKKSREEGVVTPARAAPRFALSIKLGLEPAKANGKPLAFAPFQIGETNIDYHNRVVDEALKKLVEAGYWDGYAGGWTAKAEAKRGMWVNPA